MTVRNIKKNLAGMQDLLIGKGVETQNRADALYPINRIDVPFAVDTVAEMSALDVALYTRARVYSSTIDYSDYIYDDADTSGIVSNTGAGSWILRKRVLELDYVADMKAISGPQVGQIIQLKDYASGIGVGVLYFETKATTGTDDGGSVINHNTLDFRFEQIFGPIIIPKQFGATGYGVTSDSTAINNAIAFAKLNKKGIFASDGIYGLSSPIENKTSDSLASQALNGVTIIGQSRTGVVFKALAGYPASTPIFNLDGNENEETLAANAVAQNYNKLANFTIDGDNIADRGLRLRAVSHSTFEDLVIQNIDGGINDASIVISGTTVPGEDDADTTLNCVFNRVRILNSNGWGVLGISNRTASLKFENCDIRFCAYDGMRLAYASLLLDHVTIASCGSATATTTGGFTAAKAATGAINRGLRLNACQFENNYNHEVNLDWATGWTIEGGLFTPFVRAASGQDVIRIGTTDGNEVDAGVVKNIRVAPYSSAGPVIAGINIGGNCRGVSVSDIGWDETSGVWSTHDKRYTISGESSNVSIEGHKTQVNGNDTAFTVTSALSGTPVSNITGDGTEYTTANLAANTIFADINRGPQRTRLDITSATITGTSLNVTATPATTLQVGNRLTGTGVYPNTFITSRVSGTGGAGTYTVSRSQTVSSTNMKAWDTQWFDRFTGTFTAPESGYYEFEVKWPLTGFSGSETDIETAIVIDPSGSPIRHIISKETPKSLATADRNIYGGIKKIYLNVGDEVVSSVKVSGGTKVVDFDRNFTGVSAFVFSGKIN